ncbi:MAG: ligase-associated DNA damage response DEXH box helicase [Aquimonas sp.]|nr:ligase-associated DNA damage response DEXH box helicase [Aquimonas sp.]
MPSSAPSANDSPLRLFFTTRGWTLQPFQQELWQSWQAGHSGLLLAPTGSGKTLAVWGGALLEALANPLPKPRLRWLWITPLRALAADTRGALLSAAEGVGLDLRIELRTGDSSTAARNRARRGDCDALITTPESLALLLSYADTAEVLAGLSAVVVDEWHELLGSKRGVQLELCLARLRAMNASLRCWGLSATLGNAEEALQVLCPGQPQARLLRVDAAELGQPPPVLDTVLPPAGGRFPFAGHLGLGQLPQVLPRLLEAKSTLLFTNTRAQAELWHRALSAVWPEDTDTLALHHGSLDRSLREQVEDGLRQQRLRCVVATSSLDLGVDFPAVEQVVQIGSPKGIARLLQRAGRAGHRPGAQSRLLCVPTHALELVEFAAARVALDAGQLESRTPLRGCLDVLAQHLVTLAAGGGFDPEALWSEVRGTAAFSELQRAEFDQVLDFIERGGQALQQYPEFRRVEQAEDGRRVLTDRRQQLRHRLSIGTITSDGAMRVKFVSGGDLGAVEESFIGRLKPGEVFLFAGRLLELVRLRDMTAYVRAASKAQGSVPRWMGGRMPLSTLLGEGVRALLEQPSTDSPEMSAATPILALQRQLSALPRAGELLAEVLPERGGLLLAVYPFAGRGLHEGLAALMAARLARHTPTSVRFAANDYGLLLGIAPRIELDEALLRTLLDPAGLEVDARASLNLAELARRQFRDIARIAGLLPPNQPGRAARSLRSLQASSSLIYDVLRQFDPGHVLLGLAEREVLDGELALPRLQALLQALAVGGVQIQRPDTLTPLSFPLWAETQKGALSTEDWRARMQRAAEALEARHAAGRRRRRRSDAA